MQRQLGLLDALHRQGPVDQAEQCGGLQQVAALVQQRAEGIGQGEGEDVGLVQPQPDLRQFGDPLGGRPGGEIGAIDGAYRGADHQIEGHSGVHQRLQHADLNRAETAATGENQCGVR
ncbi:hypothetical protein D3C84_1032610 [compost metagenome]